MSNIDGNSYGAAILTSAHQHDWNRVFQLLERSPNKIAIVDPAENRTLLHYACLRKKRNGVELAVTQLFKHWDLYFPGDISRIAFVDRKDSNGDTALQLATKKRNRAAVELLIRNGADIKQLKPDNDFDAVQRIYDPVFISLFDLSININKNVHDMKNELLWTVDCNFKSIFGLHNTLFQDAHVPTFNQSWHLAIMLRWKIATRSAILQHPLVRLFVHLKTEKFAKLIYFSMIYQILWSIVSFVFIFCNTHILDSTNVEDSGRESNLTVLCQPFRLFQSDSSKFKYSAYFFIMIILYVLAVVKELIEFKLYPDKRYYWKQMENLGQWIVIASILVVWIVAVLRQSGKYEEEIDHLDNLNGQKHFLWAIYLPGLFILGMFSSLLLIQSQLAKTPFLGVYNEMFVRAFRSILKFLLAFLPLMFAFLATLHILLPMRPEFVPQWGLGFAKIFVMMTGEVGYDDILYGDDEADIAFRNVLKGFFLVFVVTVVILLQNLLIGVTVSDVQKLEQTATINHLASSLEDIYLLENVLLSPVIWGLINGFGWKDWCIRTFMVGKADLVKNTKSGKTKYKRLNEYPPKLRQVIIDWHLEKTIISSDSTA